MRLPYLWLLAAAGTDSFASAARPFAQEARDLLSAESQHHVHRTARGVTAHTAEQHSVESGSSEVFQELPAPTSLIQSTEGESAKEASVLRSGISASLEGGKGVASALLAVALDTKAASSRAALRVAAGIGLVGKGKSGEATKSEGCGSAAAGQQTQGKAGGCAEPCHCSWTQRCLAKSSCDAVQVTFCALILACLFIIPTCLFRKRDTPYGDVREICAALTNKPEAEGRSPIRAKHAKRDGKTVPPPPQTLSSEAASGLGGEQAGGGSTPAEEESTAQARPPEEVKKAAETVTEANSGPDAL